MEKDIFLTSGARKIRHVGSGDVKAIVGFQAAVATGHQIARRRGVMSMKAFSALCRARKVGGP
jgi:hypothetical protein